MGLRVELFAVIRRDSRVKGLSIRQLAKEHRVSRRTVRFALAAAEPPVRKVPVGSSPKLDPLRSVIDGYLLDDLDAPRKQRHTAQRIFDRLLVEHQAVISYSSVRQYVKARRAEIAVESGVAPVEVFVPQEHAPGAEAEVDFGDVWVDLAGQRTRCYMFAFRLSHSGKSVHRIYPTCGQEAFLEGHIAAFEAIGRVPVKHIRYDNLTAAVTKVIYGAGRHRVENDRWVLFRSHYGFDSFYCEPGIKGAHEKGGIEGEVGRFRGNFLTPVPVTDSLAELNEQLRVWDESEDCRRISHRLRTIGEDFTTEQPLLAPLPEEVFDPGLVLTPRVDRSSLVTVRSVKFSVPVRFINRKVRASLRATEVVIFDGKKLIVRYPRIVARGGQQVRLDHYLEVLKIIPGALPGSTALAQARDCGVLLPLMKRSGRTRGELMVTLPLRAP